MSARLFPWVLRIGWAVAPFTVGAVLEAALHHQATVRTMASLSLWAVWACVLVATLVPHPISLTVVRTGTPAAVAAVLGAAISGDASTVALAIGTAWAVGVVVVAFLPTTGAWCVNGPAYPRERRYPLAVPGAVLLGPLELAWAAVVGLPSAAILLLASRHWVLGGVLAVAAFGAVVVLGRALHGLSRRWVVLVPAGLVLHDPMSLIDPVLFERGVIESVGPAPTGTDAVDLTQRAPGLAVQLDLKQAVPMMRITPGHRRGEAGSSARLLFTPTRPGAMLADASARRLPATAP